MKIEPRLQIVKGFELLLNEKPEDANDTPR